MGDRRGLRPSAPPAPRPRADHRRRPHPTTARRAGVHVCGGGSGGPAQEPLGRSPRFPRSGGAETQKRGPRELPRRPFTRDLRQGRRAAGPTPPLSARAAGPTALARSPSPPPQGPRTPGFDSRFPPPSRPPRLRPECTRSRLGRLPCLRLEQRQWNFHWLPELTPEECGGWARAARVGRASRGRVVFVRPGSFAHLIPTTSRVSGEHRGAMKDVEQT